MLVIFGEKITYHSICKIINWYHKLEIAMFKIYVPVIFLKYSNRTVTMQYQIDCSIRLFYQPTLCFIRVVKQSSVYYYNTWISDFMS